MDLIAAGSRGATPVLGAALVLFAACGDDPITGPQSESASVALSAGGTFTCRLDASGAAQCWGTNWWGQLGEDSFERCDLNSPCKRTPVPVAAGLRFASISASTAASPWSGHICGVTTEHDIFCWGVDKTQLGTERSDTEFCVSINSLVGQPCSRQPLRVDVQRGFDAVATGNFHTCGLATDGRVLCWGSDDNGQLGSSETEICGEFDLPCSFQPVEVSGAVQFRAVSAGALHTCALASDDTAYCWGSNESRQLGHAAALGNNVPSPTTDRRRFVALSAGKAHTCGVTASGDAICWGSNATGQLGIGTAVARAGQTRVTSGVPFEDVSAGWDHTCGLTPDGVAYCWGSNLFGQVGSDTRENARCPTPGTCSLVPARVETDLRFVALSAGGVHTCGIATDGSTYCWGDNSLGQLGEERGLSSQEPVRVGSAP